MGFWIFMLIVDLLIPVTMLGFGSAFLKQAPKEINPLFGYRTPMSMKNRETWEFAHRYCGRIWYIAGLILLPLSAAALLLTHGQSRDCIGTVGGVVCMVQLIPLVGAIFPTERALKRTFDENGARR